MTPARISSSEANAGNVIVKALREPGYLAVPVGARHTYKRNALTATLGYLAILLSIGAFTIAVLYYSVKDVKEVVSPWQYQEGMRDCQPKLLLQGGQPLGWDSMSRFEGHPAFNPAKQLWSVEFNNFTADSNATRRALADLQSQAHVLLDRLANRKANRTEQQYHRKLEYLMFSNISASGETGSVRLRPAINVLSLMNVISTNDFERSSEFWDRISTREGLEFFYPDVSILDKYSTKGRPCSEYCAFGTTSTGSATLVATNMQASSERDEYRFAAFCGQQQQLGVYRLVPNDTTYAAGLEAFTGLHELMELLPATESYESMDGWNLTKGVEDYDLSSTFRKGLEWEATQALMLDYCNNAETDPCGLKAGSVDAAAVVQKLESMGSPEVFKSHYDPTTRKVGYLYEQKLGTPFFKASAKVPGPNTTIDASGKAVVVPTSVVKYTFLVVPSFGVPTKAKDRLYGVEDVCKPERFHTDKLWLDLDYHIFSKNGVVLPKPEYFYTGRYKFDVGPEESLTNKLVPPTGMLRCNMGAWYFQNVQAPASAGNASDNIMRQHVPISAEQITLPYATETGVYNCKLFNTPFKVMSLSLPILGLAYMIVGWFFFLGAALKAAKPRGDADTKEASVGDVERG